VSHDPRLLEIEHKVTELRRILYDQVKNAAKLRHPRLTPYNLIVEIDDLISGYLNETGHEPS
jgi:hypothetical protein